MRQPRVGDFATTPAAARPFEVAGGFVRHPFVKDGAIEAREFQIRLAERCLAENLLVVVPTGLGKTLIAVLAAAETLRTRPGSVLLLAPTRPLAVQHLETMQRLLKDEGLIQLFSGAVAPGDRAKAWGKGILVVATPQTIRNDLDFERYDLSGVSLVIFDEAHRAVGDYAYVAIASRLRFENPRCRVLGLTASPGARRERVVEVTRNLGVTAVEMREATSADVSPYVQSVRIDPPVFVDPDGAIRRVAAPLRDLLGEKEAKLRKLGLVRGTRPFGLGKRELVALQQSLGRQGFFAGLHSAQLAYYARLCLDYVEVYGLDTLKRYLSRMQAKPDLKRNEKSFLKDDRVQKVLELLAKGIERSHPKIDRLLELFRGEASRRPDFTAIVFTQYRDSIPSLVDALRQAGLPAERIVGQADRGHEEGLSQDEQRDVLARFARREFRALVSTSIGEEGIDVPQVDLVVFYDAVPSEIRSIQRRGRTGRTVPGRVVTLVTRGSSDEGAFLAAARKEQKMRRLVGRGG